MTVLKLKELGARLVIAKADNEDHGQILSRIGADRVVYPQRDMGARVARNLLGSNVLDYISLSPNFSMAELVVNGRLQGKTLRELALSTRYGINVMAIRRGKRVVVSPRADEMFQEGDVIVVIGPADGIRRLESM
jgi:trk system potassium uptake protein TrkA